MAVLTAIKMPALGGEQKKLHSFFTKPERRESGIPSHDFSTGTDSSSDAVAQSLDLVRNIETEELMTATNLSATRQPAHLKPTELALLNGPELQEVDLNHSRRKRRKTESPSSKSSYQSEVLEVQVPRAAQETEAPEADALSNMNITKAEHQTLSNSPRRVSKSATGLPYQVEMSKSQQTETTQDPDTALNEVVPGSRKLLKLNHKTGTIGSPPAKAHKLVHDTSVSTSKKKRKQKSLIVKICYGVDDVTRSRIGGKVNEIRSTTNAVVSSIASRNEVPAKKPAKKSTHPFFLGGSTQKPSTLDTTNVTSQPIASSNTSPAPKPSFSSPSAFIGIRANKAASADHTVNFHTFGSTTKALKFPGAAEPIWPPKGMVHVRGNIKSTARDEESTQPDPSPQDRKSKYAAIEASPYENILNHVAANLNALSIKDKLREIDTEAFRSPDKAIRLPHKHFESGVKLQNRVRGQLKSKVAIDIKSGAWSEDELQSEQPFLALHPAISSRYRSIATSLSAFDRSQHESQSWTQKYAPTSAADVLQSGREAFILKEWLRSLTVLAVEGGLVEDASGCQNLSDIKRPKKKRRSKLDDFVVSSDEGEISMTEVSDVEDQLPNASQDVKRTVLRMGTTTSKSAKGVRKLANAVVISGPNGCGKTAMVYAVAKELGFDIFEINAGSRRTGKDIVDRVGDMTRNHLVQGSRVRDCTTMQDSSTAYSTSHGVDLETGRQETVKSFFQPKSLTKRKSKPNPKPNGEESKVKEPPKEQRQSLILLEEADLLYEEDKQFWPTVMTLMAQSKRPFIITCNDEALIPIQIMSLHAIIRIQSPPIDLAVDYALLVAANEGHVIQRSAVTSLYRSRKLDLRACLSELEAWCQIGVGDRRGGLEWYYGRWPRGCDVDEENHTIRVISEGTYQQAMDWLGQTGCDLQDTGETNECMVRYAWDVWGLHPRDIQRNHTIGGNELSGEMLEDHPRNSLSAFEHVADMMSVADLCSSGSLEAGDDIQLDTTAPDIPLKACNDFIVGYELLHAHFKHHFESLSADIAISLMSYALEHTPSSSASAPPQATSLESAITGSIEHKNSGGGGYLTRRDFSAAFDSIAEPDNSSGSTNLEPSVFDRAFSIITVDVAPYLRSIVDYDNKLQRERSKLNNLLSEGGRYGKRMRTTRSALSALEGGARCTTRKERYFDSRLNSQLVLRTGSKCWQEALEKHMEDLESSNHIAQGLDTSAED